MLRFGVGINVQFPTNSVFHTPRRFFAPQFLEAIAIKRGARQATSRKNCYPLLRRNIMMLFDMSMKALRNTFWDIL